MLVLIPTSFFTANVADHKEWNTILWFIGGFPFGPLALIAVAVMQERRSRKILRRIAEKLDPEDNKISAKEYFDKKTIKSGNAFWMICRKLLQK